MGETSEDRSGERGLGLFCLSQGQCSVLCYLFELETLALRDCFLLPPQASYCQTNRNQGGAECTGFEGSIHVGMFKAKCVLSYRGRRPVYIFSISSLKNSGWCTVVCVFVAVLTCLLLEVLGFEIRDSS
jgi:hypothetical protein